LKMWKMKMPLVNPLLRAMVLCCLSLYNQLWKGHYTLQLNPKRYVTWPAYEYFPHACFLKVASVKQNPVYLFYEVVNQNVSGMPDDPGNKHYKCYHGNCKVLTITHVMKSSLNSMCIFEMVSCF
jgi:hypothetical protein